MKKEIEKVAVYYVSKLDKEYSSELTLMKIKNYCKENDYDYTLYMDKVKSRRITTGRNELDKLKEDLKNGRFSKIIITDLSNICRDAKFNLELISFAEDNKCKIISMDNFDPHQYKRFMEFIFEKNKEGESNMNNEIEKEVKNSRNRFELEGNVANINDVYVNQRGKKILRFDLEQNNNGIHQFVPIVLKGELVNSYGKEIEKGDWISVKGKISAYSQNVERDGKIFKDKVIEILGFEITDKINNKVYTSDGQINELINKGNQIER